MNAATWANFISGIATAGSIGGFILSWHQAAKSRDAATRSRHALATALRPIVAFGDDGPGQSTGHGAVWISLSNAGAFAARDVNMRAIAAGTVIAEGTADCLPGHVPGTLFGAPDLAIEVKLPDKKNWSGNTLVINVTARFFDEQRIQQWEQQGQLTWELQDHGPRCVGFNHGKPMPYAAVITEA